MVRELLHSGLLQELIADPTEALLLGPGVADAQSMVELLVRHGMPVTLPAINAAVWRLNDNALKVLLAAGWPPVLLGSEEGPDHWRGAGEQCPLYNLLACQLDYPDIRARTTELLLAAGCQPAIYHHLVFSWWREDEEVVAHLCNFCPVEDLVAALPALRARLRDANRCVPGALAAVHSIASSAPQLSFVQPTEQQLCMCRAMVAAGCCGCWPLAGPGARRSTRTSRPPSRPPCGRCCWRSVGAALWWSRWPTRRPSCRPTCC